MGERGDKAMQEAADDRPLPPGCRPRLHRKARLRKDKISGEPVLLFPEGVLLLNPTGAAVVELCDGRQTVAEIAAVLAARCGAPDGLVAGDVREYLGRLCERGLLDWAAEG